MNNSDDQKLLVEAPPSYQTNSIHPPVTSLALDASQPPPPMGPNPANDPNIHFICTNSGNEYLYPESAKLYNLMCEKFGTHNIRPIPDYIDKEKLRKAWLKRNENALLYFLFKKDKYRETIDQMYHTNICCQLCSYKKVSKHDKHSSFSVCCLESMTYCCATWNWAPALRSMLYADLPPSLLQTTATGVCCPGCCGAAPLIATIGTRLKKIGIDAHDSNCYGRCCLCFCQPCIAMKMANIVLYMYQKRYGVFRSAAEIIAEANEVPIYGQYIQNLKNSVDHPYSKAQSVQHRLNTQLEQVNEREWTATLGSGVNDLFREYYRVDEVIAKHNKYWEGIHKISM